MTAPRTRRDSVPQRRTSAPQPLALAAASVLAHPARRRIAETLGGAPDGLTVAEIVDETGDLHHNAVRNHLRILAGAGLVSVERDPPYGRGRPTERFSLVDPEASRIAAQTELLGLLVGLCVASGADEATARAYGRQHGAGLVTSTDREDILRALARLGFAPHETTTVRDAARGGLDIRLDHCPFADAVLAPGGMLVCAVHHGILEGVAATAPPMTLSAFTPRHPHRAGCTVRLDGVPPGAGASMREARRATRPSASAA